MFNSHLNSKYFCPCPQAFLHHYLVRLQMNPLDASFVIVHFYLFSHSYPRIPPVRLKSIFPRKNLGNGRRNLKYVLCLFTRHTNFCFISCYRGKEPLTNFINGHRAYKKIFNQSFTLLREVSVRVTL